MARQQYTGNRLMNHKQLLRLIAMLLLVATSISCTALFGVPSYQSGTVWGAVLDYNSLEPLRSATVRIATPRMNVVTDSNGRFGIQSIPIGRRSVIVEQNGYVASQVAVSVERRSATCVLVFMKEPLGRTATVSSRPERPYVMVDGAPRLRAIVRDTSHAIASSTVAIAQPIFPAIPRENIASLDVVHPDAALRLYGERGSNGVVAINTKPLTRC